MMLPEILVERFAVRSLEQRVEMHIATTFPGEVLSISLAQRIDARFAALVANLATLVAAAIIKPRPASSLDRHVLILLLEHRNTE
jgi:hypothetical protein